MGAQSSTEHGVSLTQQEPFKTGADGSASSKRLAASQAKLTSKAVRPQYRKMEVDGGATRTAPEPDTGIGITMSQEVGKEAGKKGSSCSRFFNFRKLSMKIAHPYHKDEAKRLLYEKDNVSNWLVKGNTKPFSKMPWLVPGLGDWKIFCPGWGEAGEFISFDDEEKREEGKKFIIFYDGSADEAFKDFKTVAVGEANWRGWGAYFRCEITKEEKFKCWRVKYKNVYTHLSGEMHGTQLDAFVSDFEYENLHMRHRIFLTLETPHSSKLSFIYSLIILGTILLTITAGFCSTLPDYRYTPLTCANPVCLNDDELCPNSTICEPMPFDVFNTIDSICLGIFAFDYFARILLVGFVPPRLAGLVPRHVDTQNETSYKKAEGLLKETFLKVREVVGEDEVKKITPEWTIGDADTRYPKKMRGLKLGIALNWIRAGNCIGIREAVRNAGFVVDPLNEKEKERLEELKKFFHLPNRKDEHMKEKAKLMPEILDEKWPKSTCFIKYFFSIFGIVDLCAVLPLFIQLGLGKSISTNATVFIRVARAFRLVRFFRFFDTASSTSGKLYILRHTFSESLDTLLYMLIVFLISSIIFAFVIFAFERGTFQVTPEHPNGAYLRMLPYNTPGVQEESPFRTLSSALYFTIITMTTVGYGDLAATSGVGRFVSNLAALVGMLVIAFPICIINKHLEKEWENYEKLKKEKKRIEQEIRAEEKLAVAPSSATPWPALMLTYRGDFVADSKCILESIGPEAREALVAVELEESLGQGMLVRTPTIFNEKPEEAQQVVHMIKVANEAESTQEEEEALAKLRARVAEEAVAKEAKRRDSLLAEPLSSPTSRHRDTESILAVFDELNRDSVIQTSKLESELTYIDDSIAAVAGVAGGAAGGEAVSTQEATSSRIGSRGIERISSTSEKPVDLLGQDVLQKRELMKEYKDKMGQSHITAILNYQLASTSYEEVKANYFKSLSEEVISKLEEIYALQTHAYNQHHEAISHAKKIWNLLFDELKVAELEAALTLKEGGESEARDGDA